MNIPKLKLWAKRKPWLATTAVLGPLAFLGLGLLALDNYLDLQVQNATELEAVRGSVSTAAWLDLSAQQKMAEFALGVLHFSAFGFVSSVVAAVVIIFTLKATREAVEATREMTQQTRLIGQNQTRAYVQARTCWIRQHKGRATFALDVQNTGPTPAVWFDVFSKIECHPVGSNPVLPVDLLMEKCGHLAGQHHEEFYVASLAPEQQTQYEQPQKDQLFLLGVIRYCDVYNAVFESEFAFFFNCAPKDKDIELLGTLADRFGFRPLCQGNDIEALKIPPRSSATRSQAGTSAA